MLYEGLLIEIENKALIEKAMGREFIPEDFLNEIEKAVGRAQLGEIRIWGGKEYIKTPKGWRAKPKGYKESSEQEEIVGDAKTKSPIQNDNNPRSQEIINNMPLRYREQAREIYSHLGSMTNDAKSQVTPFSDPILYIVLSKVSPEKMELIEKLRLRGEVIEENEVETGTTGLYKIGNEYIRVIGTSIETGLKQFKSKSQRLGMSGHKRWYGGNTMYSKTDKSDEFSVFDTEKVKKLLSKIK